MSPQSVSRPRPAPQVPTVKQMGKRLTLADVTVVRRSLGEEVTRLTGPALALLIAAERPTPNPLLETTGGMADELDSIAAIIQVLGAADYHEAGLPLDRPLTWIGAYLRRLAVRVTAVRQTGTTTATSYDVEVTR